jgi:glutamine amidotransferase
MGWNNIYSLNRPLFSEIKEDEYVYFVHSYYVERSGHAAATANYVWTTVRLYKKIIFYAVQFHPEKSGKTGEKILKNFIEL